MMVEISGVPTPEPPVRAVTVTSEVMSVPELVMNAFSPSITHSPPAAPSAPSEASRGAASRVGVGLGQAEAAQRPPAHRSGSHCWRCASVPNR